MFNRRRLITNKQSEINLEQILLGNNHYGYSVFQGPSFIKDIEPISAEEDYSEYNSYLESIFVLSRTNQYTNSNPLETYSNNHKVKLKAQIKYAKAQEEIWKEFLDEEIGGEFFHGPGNGDWKIINQNEEILFENHIDEKMTIKANTTHALLLQFKCQDRTDPLFYKEVATELNSPSVNETPCLIYLQENDGCIKLDNNILYGVQPGEATLVLVENISWDASITKIKVIVENDDSE